MTSAPPAKPDLSVFDALIPLLQRWRFVMVIVLMVALPTAIVSLLLPPVFTASTTFTPETGSGGSGLGGLAALAGRFGVPVDPRSVAASPDFFAAILQSRELLKATVESKFPAPSSPDVSASLLELWDVEGDTPEHRTNNGIRALRQRIAVRVQMPTGIITLNVKDESPLLAASIANAMVRLLNDFNLQRRQSQSRESRRFAGERILEVANELRAAEAEHLRFLQANRRFSESPVLAFEEARLRRAVELKQEVYITLNREYEEARVAEVRDTPLLTTIDAATPPDKRTSPRRRRMVTVAALLGAFAAVAFVYGQRYLHYLSRTGRSDFAAFRQSLSALFQDLRLRRGQRPHG